MKIAILAMQGAFEEHEAALRKKGVETTLLRSLVDLEEDFHGLVLPGGESTTMGHLLRETAMLEPLRRRIQEGLPTLATCAGMILLAQDIANDERRHLATLPIRVVRNGYGRQLDSFVGEENFAGKPIPMVFIRAPYVESVGEGVEILSKVDDKIVAVRYENQLAMSFHPELTTHSGVYDYFLEEMVASSVRVQFNTLNLTHFT